MQVWFLIAAIVVNLSLALIVFTRFRSATSTAYFAMSSLFVVAWALGTLAMLYGTTLSIASLGLIVFLLAPMITTLYMVLFAKHLAEVNYPSRYVSTIIFTLFTLLAVGFAFVSLQQANNVLIISGSGQNILNFHQIWYGIYGSYFSIMFCLSYIYLIIGLVRHKGRVRRQLRYVFWGIFLTSFLALFTNILLPFFGNTNLIWLGPTGTIFYVVATSFSMARYRLFDLRQALVLTFTYILSLLALAALYYGFAFTISSLFLRDNSVFGSADAVNVGLALLLAFLFQPIRKFFDRFTNRIFYRDQYNSEEFFARITRKISKITDLSSLLTYASSEISKTLKASFGAFLVYREGSEPVYIAEDKRRKIPSDDIKELDVYIHEKGDNVILADMLGDQDLRLKRMLASHRIALVLPIMQANVITGYLFLGQHLSAQYTTRDIRALETIADELMIAIQNALSIQEVKDLNATLQQRIDTATKELRATNAQLHRLDEAKDEFISMASHQLRTPLTSVKGYISMVLEGDAGKVTSTQKQLLGEAFGSSERMVHLINDFLDVSRLQTGKFVIDKKSVNLALVVKDELAALATSAAQRGMSFIYKMPKKFPLLMLDEGKIRQVIMNFCDNAIYYSKDGSKIIVELSLTDKDVIFVVKDSGIGVPLDQQAHVFTKFFRATNARTQRPDGTGVGLFLAKKVMIAHGGDVIFESKENKGSTFGFRLPLSELNVTAENVN